MTSDLRRKLLWLGAGMFGSASMAWWLARFEPLRAADYELLKQPLPGEAELPAMLSEERLRQHTDGLAAIGTRRGGTPGETAAREWVRERFEQAGLHDVHVNPVIYPRWRRRHRSEVTFFTPAPYDPDFVVLNGSTPTPAGGSEHSLIDVGSGSETEYLLRNGRGLAGTVHLITDSQEPRRDLVLRAAGHGAAAVVLANDTPSTNSRQLIENGTATAFPGKIPALAISYETGQYLRSKLKDSQVRALLHINVGYKIGGTANVVGEIPGVSSQFVVLAAHYDSWYSGAADNAAGVACLLELANHWMNAGLRPKRTIRFVSYAAEEEGLMGSLFDVFLRAPLVKARCRGVVTPDTVGVPSGRLAINGFPTFLAELGAQVAQQMGYTAATGYDTAAPAGPEYADHWPYAQIKLPALVVSKGPDPYYHTPFDTADRLDYTDLRWTAAISGALALRLAQR
ncbi:MAG: M20/M25/M40 family metallo-hydrolase [Caldilineales bacterium]